MLIFFILGILGMVISGIGLIYLFNKDTAWQWTSENYKRQGVKTERTAQWDGFSNVTGIIMVCVGLVLFGLSLSLYDAQHSAMSGSYINGTQLTVDQARAYRADPNGFLISFCAEHPNVCDSNKGSAP